MTNVLYDRIIVPAKESPDGESPTMIVVTQEANGYAVWLTTYYGTRLLVMTPRRNSAIERTVALACEPFDRIEAHPHIMQTY